MNIVIFNLTQYDIVELLGFSNGISIVLSTFAKLRYNKFNII